MALHYPQVIGHIIAGSNYRKLQKALLQKQKNLIYTKTCRIIDILRRRFQNEDMGKKSCQMWRCDVLLFPAWLVGYKIEICSLVVSEKYISYIF